MDDGHRCLCVDLLTLGGIWEAGDYFQRHLGFILCAVGSCCPLALEARGVLVHVEKQDGVSP